MRTRVILGVLLLAAFLVAAVFVFKSPKPPTGTAQPVPPSPLLSDTEAPPVAQPVPAPKAVAPQASAPPKPVESVAIQAGPRSARELMGELVELSGAAGPITQEQAERFKQNLAELVKLGAAAVPAIREFLEQKGEFGYNGIEGAQLLGYPSLRASLIDTLQQINGPEAQEALLHEVKTTALPSELLALAKSLETQAPGQYRDEILSSARETLAMAATNQLQLGTNVELGPAFRILRNYGDADSTADVAKHDPANFLNAIALASLPDGQGLPSLLTMAGNSGGSQAGATEMIAQLASQNADALEALVRLAQKGQIPSEVWVRLAPILGGDQYQLAGSPGPDASGTQNYAVVNVATTPEQINQRIVVIDALLGFVEAGSGAAAALRHERDTLIGKLGP